MHPYLTGVFAEAHIKDLHQDAARHRLAAEARAAQLGAVPVWRHAAAAALRRALTPIRVRRAQPVCCPA